MQDSLVAHTCSHNSFSSFNPPPNDVFISALKRGQYWNNSWHMCNGGKGDLTFVHQSTWCTGSQGPSGLGYGPPSATVWLLQAGKVIITGLLPMTVTQDVTSYVSYRISGSWHIQCYVTIYIMYRQYKSSCNPVPGSPFASLGAAGISTPLPIEPP